MYFENFILAQHPITDTLEFMLLHQQIQTISNSNIDTNDDDDNITINICIESYIPSFKIARSSIKYHHLPKT